jgi:hypothetical protein
MTRVEETLDLGVYEMGIEGRDLEHWQFRKKQRYEQWMHAHHEMKRDEKLKLGMES